MGSSKAAMIASACRASTPLAPRSRGRNDFRIELRIAGGAFLQLARLRQDSAARSGVNQSRQLFNVGRCQEISQRNLHTVLLTKVGDQFDHFQRMPVDGEEILPDANGMDAQRLFPDKCDVALCFVADSPLLMRQVGPSRCFSVAGLPFAL